MSLSDVNLRYEARDGMSNRVETVASLRSALRLAGFESLVSHSALTFVRAQKSQGRDSNP
jgi:hypothetical protein